MSNLVRHVVCGISGGVDSAIALYLLKKKGFHVTGVFMKNWDSREEIGSCLSGGNDLEDARAVCRKLDVELLEVSFIKEYWNDVFSSLLEDYENGLTPNPDVLCNRFVKFGAFYRHARNELGADAIATGHYARTTFGSFLERYRPNYNVELMRALDLSKDQTLFLSQVEQEALRRTMFPLGSLYKHAVRQLARELGLTSVAKKKDSTGICFIGNRNFADFIHEYIPDKRGPFVYIENNEILGWHRGVHHWTIGQGCRIGGMKQRLYVAHRDPITQTIYVAPGRYHASLFSNELVTSPPHWIASPPPITLSTPFICMFKFQHTEWTIPCQVWPDQDNRLRVHLSIPTRAVTPGQYAVFYRQDICLGNAKIYSKSMSPSFKSEKEVKLIGDQCAVEM